MAKWKRKAIVAGLIVIVGAAAGRTAEVDSSLLPICAALAEGQREATLVSTFKNHPVMGKLRQGFGSGFTPSVDFAEKADQMAATINHVQDHLDRLIAEAHALGSLLPDGAIPDDVKVHFLCGSPSDGFGFIVDGEKQLFVDVGNVSTGFLPHLLKHEFWHVGFKQAFPDQFKSEFYADDPLRRLAYQMVNEGVGHYYSLRRRLVPENTYADWEERTAEVFSLLHQRVPEIMAAADIDEQNRLIFSSHAGVPFWKKWGAIPGAIITHRLIEDQGEARVAALIKSGPAEFLSYYQKLTDVRPGWDRLPDELLAAFRR